MEILKVNEMGENDNPKLIILNKLLDDLFNIEYTNNKFNDKKTRR